MALTSLNQTTPSKHCPSAGYERKCLRQRASLPSAAGDCSRTFSQAPIWPDWSPVVNVRSGLTRQQSTTRLRTKSRLLRNAQCQIHAGLAPGLDVSGTDFVTTRRIARIRTGRRENRAAIEEKKFPHRWRRAIGDGRSSRPAVINPNPW